MASSSKTTLMGLNEWSQSDKPEMEDFNQDNAIIDSVVGQHIGSVSQHLASHERAKWNNPYGSLMYHGDGAVTRAITLNFGILPSFCIVFAIGVTPGIVDIQNDAHYNFFGFATTDGSTTGLNLDGLTLTVTQSPTPVMGHELRSYNKIGNSYLVIAFR